MHKTDVLKINLKDGGFSEYSVQVLFDCLEKCGFSYPYKKIVYPSYGHMLPLKKKVMKQVFDWIG